MRTGPGTGLAAAALAAACLLLLPTTASGGEARDYAYLHVRGRLLHGTGGGPMAGAEIRLVDGKAVFQARTDSKGVFVFDKLPLSEYEMTITGAGGKVLKSIEELDLELPALKRFSVRMGHGDPEAAKIQAGEEGVSIDTPPVPVRWGRLWKQGLVFVGAAVLLAL